MIQYYDSFGLANQVQQILGLLGNKQGAYLDVEDWIDNDFIIEIKGCNIVCNNGIYPAQQIISYCDKYQKKLSIHIR